ncbi:MAG: hypothetical protein EBT98_09205 [Opitutaceae bacterium]|nr:hypothetical protein [Opitutaceae bacterium]
MGRCRSGRRYFWFLPPLARKTKAGTCPRGSPLARTDRVGTLEVGKDADVIILNGPPLSVKSWVQRTYVNGELVHKK